MSISIAGNDWGLLMGLYNLLTTSASGMNAQSALLNTVSDNIANVSTVGYKEATAEFSSLVLNSGLTGDYQSGSVLVHPEVEIDGQGSLESGTSTSNLAIKGNGFFIVEGPGNTPVLTRAGAFTVSNSGELVNAAGYTLLGYAAGTSGVANGYSGLLPVNVSSTGLQATPTTSGQLYVNLPEAATAVGAANLPSMNSATATYTEKTSLTAYDNLGGQVTLDVYLTKSAAANTWEVAVYNAAGAPTTGTFPYSAGSLLGSGTLSFNSTTGALTGGSPISFTIPNGSTVSLDMSQTTQLTAAYQLDRATTNGNAPSAVKDYTIGTDGTVSITYTNGSSKALYTIPLATVASPNNMTVISGNAYVPNQASGTAQIGTAGTGAYGLIASSQLEGSTVDLASELTTMIAAQNNYEANSKVFNTGSQLFQVLVNLGK